MPMNQKLDTPLNIMESWLSLRSLSRIFQTTTKLLKKFTIIELINIKKGKNELLGVQKMRP